MIKKTWLMVLGLLAVVGWSQLVFAGDAGGGKALYDKSCAGCHGSDGKGNANMAKILGDKGLNIVGADTVKKSDEQLLKVIADGAGKMRPSKLSPAEQKQILGYVRTLAK